MRNLTFVSIIILVFITVDIYVFQGVKTLTASFTPVTKKVLYFLYWSLTVIAVVSFLAAFLIGFEKWNRIIRLVLISVLTVSFFTKFFFMFFVLIDDLQRGIRWVVQKITAWFSSEPVATENAISRSEFLLKAGVVAASVPLVGMTWGILSGAHDYRVRRHRIVLKNLPSSFHGLKIVQLSDIHSGSFYNKTAVKGGVEMAMKEKADVIFFTGDLVNNESSEMKNYLEVFEKIKAPLGVYSTLGNHDYGDYAQWSSVEAKKENLRTLMNMHKQMGWDLLMNEHRMLERGGEKLAIIGVENWGAKGRFPKYGKMKEAYKNTDDASVKLLLSHDPSHWDAQIRKEYSDIDIMFSGHTHGMQFGIENEFIKWSPVQYMYDQWAGLYKEGDQHLYVNRGFGFIGFPGRIGMLPEITVMELVKA
ncbi:MAG TPA: metallophosphoesterase [Cytophagaceae bacterium]|jgi:predicted MPP superfamily phosphohydrolase|nr:metallophosphoesterase [Cytophagaceae bacterium]